MATRSIAFALICILAISGCAQIRPEPSRELHPHWAAFPTPHYAQRYDVRIDVPSGYRLCSTAESFSSLLVYYVPLDKRVRCEDLPDSENFWEEMPDFVYVEPTPDVPMKYEDTEDVVADETFFCHGKNFDYPTPHSISNAPTSITPAGKFLAGADTVACVREDVEKDRYSKAYLSYRPNPDFIGTGYKIGAYVHLRNKRQADKLLDQVVRSFKVLPPTKR